MGWGSLLTGRGQRGRPAGQRINTAFTQGTATGKIGDNERAWFASRGPGATRVGKIRIPTLLTQGTVDTLFTLREAEANYRMLQVNKVPVKMIWHCGGHGTCDFPAGEPGRIERAALKWFDRYLNGNTATDTGAAFEWVDDKGTWHTSAGYPLTPGRPDRQRPRHAAAGPGVTTGSPTDAMSGSPNVEVAIGAPKGPESVVGSPELDLAYSGTASPAQTFVYAQVVDKKSGQVLGNQVTPIPVTLDGTNRKVSRPLESIAAQAGPGLAVGGPDRARHRAVRAPALHRRGHLRQRQGHPADRRAGQGDTSSSRSARSPAPGPARCAGTSAPCASGSAPPAARSARSPSWSSAASAWWPSRAASTPAAAASPRCASSRSARKGTYTVVAAGKDAAGARCAPPRSSVCAEVGRATTGARSSCWLCSSGADPGARRPGPGPGRRRLEQLRRRWRRWEEAGRLRRQLQLEQLQRLGRPLEVLFIVGRLLGDLPGRRDRASRASAASAASAASGSAPRPPRPPRTTTTWRPTGSRRRPPTCGWPPRPPGTQRDEAPPVPAGQPRTCWSSGAAAWPTSRARVGTTGSRSPRARP